MLRGAVLARGGNPVEPGGEPEVGVQLRCERGVGAAEKLLIGAGRTQLHCTNMDGERWDTGQQLIYRLKVEF